ncbi:hypothetical protein NPIL_72091 [Nephila pilipes]|uniref:Uncharacterized protein n=1 Tax=Nephila pilipes TaxID=299642 RepID=A0A8X6TJ43_NEPPI|nr:hypothetical protein NPIL_72091 [Nephila pilipes]
MAQSLHLFSRVPPTHNRYTSGWVLPSYSTIVLPGESCLVSECSALQLRLAEWQSSCQRSKACPFVVLCKLGLVFYPGVSAIFLNQLRRNSKTLNHCHHAVRNVSTAIGGQIPSTAFYITIRKRHTIMNLLHRFTLPSPH